MDIQPIETRYKGYRFRSRLEARWAVFFDALGVAWEYEKEGYTLGNGERYLPDFWLPAQEWWWEVKGESAKEDFEKCRMLRDGVDRPVLLVEGPPGEHAAAIFCWDAGYNSGGSSDWVIERFAWTRPNPLVPCIAAAPHEVLHARSSLDKPLSFVACTHGGESAIHESTGVELFLSLETPVDAAYRQARAARFEFGESGGRRG